MRVTLADRASVVTYIIANNPPVAANPSTEIALPQKTLADTLAARETVYVTCGHPMCCRSTRLDIQVPIDRLGPDHGSMHQDLAGLFICSACEAAGRDRRPVFSTSVPDYESHTRSSTATGSRRSNDKMATGRAGWQDLARSYASTECDIGAT